MAIDWGGLGDFASDLFGAGRYQPSQTAALLPMTPEAPTAGGGWWDSAQSGLKNFGGFAKDLSPLLGLGATGLGAFSAYKAGEAASDRAEVAERAEGRAEQLSQQAQSAAAPSIAFGSDALTRAAAGTIPEAIQAKIDLWKQGAVAQMRDYLARAGMGDSQTLAQMEAEIDKQATAMGADYLEREKALGINALQAGGGTLTAAGGVASTAGARAGAGADSLDQLIAQANASLARLSGGAA